MAQDNSSSLGVAVPGNDPDMRQAFLEARRTVEQFIQCVQKPTPTQEYFAVKVRLNGNDLDEFIWVSDIAYDGFAFTGKIVNQSDLLPSPQTPGDVYHVHKDDIVDWMIVDKGQLIGGYTIRVARNKMTPQNRKRLDATLWFAVD